MGYFLTSPALTEQLPEKGMYKLLSNELYQDDDGSIYLAWRGFKTDNFTWIKKGDWDIRCSHLHDVGCKYHQMVKVRLTERQLRSMRLLHTVHNKLICDDIPAKYLKVIDVSGHWINNLFYRMLRDADCPRTPKYIQFAYRAGVSFNINWFRSGKEKIDLDSLYEEGKLVYRDGCDMVERDV